MRVYVCACPFGAITLSLDTKDSMGVRTPSTSRPQGGGAVLEVLHFKRLGNVMCRVSYIITSQEFTFLVVFYANYSPVGW